jgi:hypothetical protein
MNVYIYTTPITYTRLAVCVVACSCLSFCNIDEQHLLILINADTRAISQSQQEQAEKKSQQGLYVYMGIFTAVCISATTH